MKIHVYKLVLGFMFTLLCITTQAQEYTYIPMVKPGIQIWTCIASSEHYMYYNNITGQWVGGQNYCKFALTEDDTIIDNLTFKKLYLFTDSVFDVSTAQCIGGLREENKKVYYNAETYFQGQYFERGLLCDFSLSKGDTFYYGVLSEGYNSPYNVIDVDTIDINGVQRRRITIGSRSNSDFYYSNNEVCKIIEGIGNELGLLFNIEEALWTKSKYTNASLRCYEYNGELQYHQGAEGCGNPYLGLNEIQEEDNTVSIYPNPASESITIGSENIIKSIEIYNPLGQRVYQTKVNAKLKSIDINSLPKGIYIIGVNTEEGYIKKKFIKN
jgi:hypothetical protein